MKKLEKGSNSASKAVVVTENPEKSRRTGRPDPISLENFAEDSKTVIFTEKESVEAIKRLGYTFQDFGYKSMLDFKRPGCDLSVTQLLFTKSEARRQEIISEARKMREIILNENEAKNKAQVISRSMGIVGNNVKNNNKDDNKDDSKEDVFLKVKRKELERERERLEEICNNRLNELKKLVIIQLREMFLKQLHIESMQKTNERMERAYQMKQDALMTAQRKAISVCLPPIYGSNDKNDNKNDLIDKVDIQLERLKKLREEENKQRKQKATEDEEKYKKAIERSIQTYEKIREANYQKTYVKDEIKSKNFQKLLEEKKLSIEKLHKERIEHEQNVVNLSKKLEECKIEGFNQKIDNKDKRSKSASLNYQKELDEKLKSIKERIDSRTLSALEELNKQQENREKFREKLDHDDQSLINRINEKSRDTTLKYVSRSFDRDVKVSKVHNKQLAKQHFDTIRFDEMRKKETKSNELIALRQRSKNQKDLENSKFLSMREQILFEFNEMLGPMDNKGLRNIQHIIGISDEEMDELVNMAKPPSINGQSRNNNNNNDNSNDNNNNNNNNFGNNILGDKKIRPGTAMSQPLTTSKANGVGSGKSPIKQQQLPIIQQPKVNLSGGNNKQTQQQTQPQQQIQQQAIVGMRPKTAQVSKAKK